MVSWLPFTPDSYLVLLLMRRPLSMMEVDPGGAETSLALLETP